MDKPKADGYLSREYLRQRLLSTGFTAAAAPRQSGCQLSSFLPDAKAALQMSALDKASYSATG